MPAEGFSDERLDKMLAHLSPIFKKEFKVASDNDVEWLLFSFAPGRINFIGEHSDYMEGFVCPAAITEGTHILVGRVKRFATEAKPALRFFATLNGQHFAMDELGGSKHDKSWTTFIRGAVTLRLNFLKKQISDPALRGVCMVVHCTQPMGAGMSASAAYGVALINAINAVCQSTYKGPSVTPSRRHCILADLPKEDLIEIAKQGRLIETEFCGVNVGIMDQFNAALAQHNKYMFLNCLDLTFELCDMTPLLGDSYCWMLIDSMVKHDLLGGTAETYNRVRNDQENAQKKISAKRFGGKPFTFALMARNPKKFTQEDPIAFVEGCKDFLEPLEYSRGRYQLMEQLRSLEFKRVCADTSVTREERVRRVGEILNTAHAGMRDLMKITTPELDFVQEEIMKDPDVAGGRMMGGGFGGCIIMLLKKDAKARVVANVRKAFKAKYNMENKVYYVDDIGCGGFLASLANGHKL